VHAAVPYYCQPVDIDAGDFTLGCAYLDGLSYRHVVVNGGTAVELDLTDNLRGPAGSMHGGLVTMLVDVAGAFCIARATERPVATASTSIQYLAAARVGPIRATATVLRVSETLGVADVQLVDLGKDSRLIAVAHVTCRLLPGESFVRTTS